MASALMSGTRMRPRKLRQRPFSTYYFPWHESIQVLPVAGNEDVEELQGVCMSIIEMSAAGRHVEKVHTPT